MSRFNLNRDWFVRATFAEGLREFAFARVVRARTAHEALQRAKRTICDADAYNWEAEVIEEGV